MARNKEALLLLIDVSPPMHRLLPEVEKLCSMLIQKKLIYSKSDEVGIVIFGTEETENELMVEVGGYEHVMVFWHVKVVDIDLFKALHKLPRGNTVGDFLDALVVGLDMLLKKFGPTNKGKQRLCLITSAQHLTKEPYEGTKEDQVDAISAQMKAHGIRLDCIIVRGKLTVPVDQKIIEENDQLLNRFSKKTNAKVVHVDNPISLCGALRTRNVSPVTIFRGDLELTSLMKIKVWVYKKTSVEKLPTLKKYSEEAPPTDKYASREVKVDYEYKSLDDSSKVVPPEQRIKGYRYGPQVVPISSAEWEAVKFKPEKGVKLLGFTDASNIMRHHYMKDVYVVIPEPGHVKAIVAVSAVAKAMKDLNKVAIMRCVWRQGQANVSIGLLTPNISSMDNVPDSFYLNILPFAEDIREFQFPSFSNFPSSLQPNKEQQVAADNFVTSLDLASPDKEEALKPDLTPNPVLERFYEFLELKAKQPDAEVPPLDRSFKQITEPDPELFSKSKTVLDVIRNKFVLKENPKIKKSTRRLWRDKPSTSNEREDLQEEGPEIESGDVTRSSLVKKVDEIGNLTPIQDFEAMMARRDSPIWVSKAIKGMKVFIYDLLENSYKGDTCDQAVECLIALRRGCILEQEPAEFNQFMQYLCHKCKENDLKEFLKLLRTRQITLISKKEAEDSSVEEDAAKNFLVKTEAVD
ncbi:hypothetical protein H6P81_016720 [Aristolochia fimbriata]|uniref:ATP-dependent DNA helicase 2 subunit KU80 n=1 Tax=Aristolochia fimbriata TaxID=158543 RepID=A0AAV7E925_ARIFI|nr:hypothetical protein H6P81_016720 [Aristolochia fimbriata]